MSTLIEINEAIARLRTQPRISYLQIIKALRTQQITTVRGAPFTRGTLPRYMFPATARAAIERRRDRLLIARTKGSHTREEWLAILARADGRCEQCGETRPLTKDHIKAVYAGGDDSAANLRAICRPCNSSRGPMLLKDSIRSLRLSLGEDTDTFGARFLRSGRTVEDWEQGRRHPDALALKQIQSLGVRTRKQAAKRAKKANESAP